MNSVLEQIYRTKHVEDAEGNAIDPFPVATPYNVGVTLKTVIQKYDLEHTLEIGMAYGLSTLFICQAHCDRGRGAHISIDPKQSKTWKSIGINNIKKSGLEKYWRLLEMPSDRALPNLVLEGHRLDFAFIDGMHLFDYVLLDFFYIDKMLRVGGYIVFDDLWMPAIRKVVSFVLKNKPYVLEKVDTGIGWFEKAKIVLPRLIQEPPNLRSTNVQLIASNICLLRKTAEDRRKWNEHVSF